MAPQPSLPLVLLAAAPGSAPGGPLAGDEYVVVPVPSGTLALEQARATRPDVILLEADLPDMAGLEACRRLRADPRLGGGVPILILTVEQPTPEQRVTALHAGVWDFVRVSAGHEELKLKLQAYVQAKRNIDAAMGEGLVDPATGLYTRLGLARRARELGALMARTSGALACVVFAFDPEAATGCGGLVARVARMSDVVGTLDPSECAVLAPGTDDAGAVHLARRIRARLRATRADGASPDPGARLRAGYEAVANLKYSPSDPVALLARATAAVRHGVGERAHPWVRRFPPHGPTPRVTPTGLVLDTEES
jgi:PleD family two-component response regulator